MQLTPTLWRTGRVLAGATRLELLRTILATPGRCVTDLARAAGISETRASQELRRLQSRGLVQRVRSGPWTRYRPVTDPKVASAKPLLAAAKEALAKTPAEETIRVAKAYAHERRLALVRVLQGGSRGPEELRVAALLSRPALFRHLAVLKAGGVARRAPGGWELAPHPHPLAKAFLALLNKV